MAKAPYLPKDDNGKADLLENFAAKRSARIRHPPATLASCRYRWVRGKNDSTGVVLVEAYNLGKP